MRKGFTLAEVLLALTIIGVISALTLPGLKSNIGTRKQNAWYKKYCNIIDGAAAQAMLENNVANATSLSMAQIQSQLQGRTVGDNFTMKDGTVVEEVSINALPGTSGGPYRSIKVTFPESLNINPRYYILYDDLEGVDCRNNGQTGPAGPPPANH